MAQQAALAQNVSHDDAPDAIPTATGLTRPVLVADLASVPDHLREAVKKTGITLVEAQNVAIGSVQLKDPDLDSFVATAKRFGAKRIYLWDEPLHARASPQAHLSHLEDVLQEMDLDTDDPDEQEAQQELADELQRARAALMKAGTVLWGAGFIADSVMHTIFITEEGLVDALIVLSNLLDTTGGREADDMDDDLHEMEPEDAADRIVEHVENDMEVPAREMRRRANELARQAAHRLTNGDELGPVDRQRVQQAIKIAAVRMRKGQ